MHIWGSLEIESPLFIMSKKEKQKLLGQLRIPIPPPGGPDTTKKGKKGYNRKDNKKELYNTMREIPSE